MAKEGLRVKSLVLGQLIDSTTKEVCGETASLTIKREIQNAQEKRRLESSRISSDSDSK